MSELQDISSLNACAIIFIIEREEYVNHVANKGLNKQKASSKSWPTLYFSPFSCVVTERKMLTTKKQALMQPIGISSSWSEQFNSYFQGRQYNTMPSDQARGELNAQSI